VSLPSQFPHDLKSDVVLEVRRYLATPTRCLDCTLEQAAKAQQAVQEETERRICSSRARLSESMSSVDATDVEETGSPEWKMQQFDMCQSRITENLHTQAEDIQAIWRKVQREWEGCLRGVIRGDGSGEGEERCVFSFDRVDVGGKPFEGDAGADADTDGDGDGETGRAKGIGRGSGQVVAGWEGEGGRCRVLVEWVSV